MQSQIKQGERAIIIAIDGSPDFQKYLLSNGLSIGTIITKNYSPAYAHLINISVGGKMLSLRSVDFHNLELVKI